MAECTDHHDSMGSVGNMRQETAYPTDVTKFKEATVGNQIRL